MSTRCPSIASVCLVIFLLAAVDLAMAHDTVWPGDKLQILAPAAASFEQRNLYLADQQRQRLEAALGTALPVEDLQPSIYFSIVKKTPDGPSKRDEVILFVDADGKEGKIEIGSVITGQGRLARVHLFENKEDQSLVAADFLGQFSGKSAAEPFVVGRDITAPAGQEESARAIAAAVRRSLLLVEELFRRR